MSRSIRIVALVGALLLPAGASGEPVDLDRAVAIALARDPRLAALAEEERALGEAARAADRILGRNPTLGVEAGTSKSAADGTVFEWAVEVEQPLEIGGQPSARRATVRAAIDRNRAEQEVRRREVREAVRSRFVRLLAARERVEILSLADRLAAAAAEAAQARFEAGELRRVERNAARLERARTARSLAAAVVANASAEAELRQILGMGAGEPLEVEGALVPRDLGAVAPPEGDLLELPSPASPESLPRTIAARRAQQEAAAQLELAESSAVPDLGVGAFYEREFETDRYFLTLSMAIPLFDRNEGERSRARAELARSRAAAEEELRAAEAERLLVGTRLRHARAALLAWEAEAIDALEENLELAAEAFRDGDLPWHEYLLVWRETLEGRLALVDAAEEWALAQAAWERLMGGPRSEAARR